MITTLLTYSGVRVIDVTSNGWFGSYCIISACKLCIRLWVVRTTALGLQRLSENNLLWSYFICKYGMKVCKLNKTKSEIPFVNLPLTHGASQYNCPWTYKIVIRSWWTPIRTGCTTQRRNHFHFICIHFYLTSHCHGEQLSER